jgi:hypothetical protein
MQPLGLLAPEAVGIGYRLLIELEILRLVDPGGSGD